MQVIKGHKHDEVTKKLIMITTLKNQRNIHALLWLASFLGYCFDWRLKKV